MASAARKAMFAAMLAAAGAACGGERERTERERQREREPAIGDGDGHGRGHAADSNVRREDYIGPEACAECHPEKHETWQRSLHALMNQRALGDAVAGDWSTQLAYGGGTARFTREDGAPIME